MGQTWTETAEGLKTNKRDLRMALIEYSLNPKDLVQLAQEPGTIESIQPGHSESHKYVQQLLIQILMIK